MGDPAGIGGELTERAWLALHDGGPCFVALDDPGRFKVPTVEIASAEAAAGVFAAALPVIPVGLAATPRPGHPDKANAPAVIASIERAAGLCLSGEASGMVTNPINKAALYGAGFAYPGHTEFLAALTGATGRQIMMLASPELRVVPVTVHASLRSSIAMLTTEAIVAAGETTAQALQREFGIAQPRLAVAGLNPHAGEQGALGDEESTIIGPAIALLRQAGIEVSGPWPPDTMFTATARRRYDAAICMYHDQALIPLKTLDMDRGVNVTLGLPIVRTSPDHGTAYDIAGKWAANPASLIAAIQLAAELGKRRADA
jgi:4-hydroxythreonine-4-phosphate dehydrogenase